MTYPLRMIPGIGQQDARRLSEAGLRTLDDLLEAAARPKGRADLAAKTGIGEGAILEWANRADLMRVRGLGRELLGLLEAIGVNTVAELKRRRPDRLAAALKAANETRNLLRRVPSEAQCAKLIEAAKALPRILSY